MKKSGLVLFFVGVVAFCAVLAWQDVGEVFELLAGAGFGLVLVALYHVVPLFFDAVSWHALLVPDKPRPSFLETWRIRWIGESLNVLLFSIGGELVKLRLMARRGVGLARTGASILVDMTLALLTQLACVGAGIALVVASGSESGLPEGLALGLSIVVAVSLGLFFLQRTSLFERVVRLLSRVGLGSGFERALGGMAEFDRELRALHRNPRALISCTLARLAAWVLGTGEVWLGLRVLGSPIGLTEAFVMESLCQAVRTAGFAIPGALGVQEGGYVFVGRLLGLDEEIALALSLARRFRDLLLGLPGLLAWQWAEGRTLLGTEERSGL